MLRASNYFRLFRLPTRTAVLVSAACIASACTVTLETIPHDVTRTEASTGDGTMSDAIGDAIANDANDANTDDAVDGGPLDVMSDAVASDANDVVDAPDDTIVEVCVPETCNGIDDNCDGLVDNGIAPQVCGMGSCARVVAGCIGGSVPACSPGAANPEVCNGLDDDCDGTVDDVPPPPPCGLGACSSPVGSTCGGVGVACVGGTTAMEICGNGIDDNCNGTVDDGCNCAAYVRSGAPTTNTGLSPTSPLPTITLAIRALTTSGTRGNVCVGALASGSCVATTYTESFAMSEGISVFGGYNGATWVRSPTTCQTIIQSVNATGVFFGHGLTRATQIDGFTIRASGNVTTGTASAVTLQEGGVVANNDIVFGVGAPAVGIAAITTLAVTDTPLIVGNTISAPDTSTPPGSARGILVSGISAEIRNNTIDGGRAAVDSAGIELRDAHGSIVADNPAIRGTGAPRSMGIFANGATGNIVIARNALIRGGIALTAAAGGGGPFGSFGIHVARCSERGLRIMDNALVTSLQPPPGSTFSNVTETNGIRVEACDAIIETNAVVTGSTTTAAAPGGAIGIRCTGSGSSCTIAGNGSISGTTSSGSPSQRTVGISVDNGAYALIDHNRNILGSALSGVFVSDGIFIDSAADETLVEGNSVESNTGAMYGRGIFGANTRARIWNNFVHADGMSGIVIGTYGGARSPSAHSNTVVSTGSAARTFLLVTDIDMGGASTPGGTFSNNVAVCLGSATGSSAFFTSGGHPAVFTNNDLYGCASLYRDGTMVNLTDIAMINAIVWPGTTYGGNIAGDPRLTSGTNGHLTAGSAALDTGTPNAAPPRDVDGNPRPQGAGYDIGFDEAPLP